MIPIGLQCIFYKAQTLIDGGWRVSLDCSEDMAEPIMEASRLKGERLYCVIMTEAEYHNQKSQRKVSE